MQAAATSMRRLAQHRRVLSEVLDQRKATSEVLRVISNSPIDLPSALGAVAESAARLLDVTDVEILRVEGNALRVSCRGGIRTAQRFLRLFRAKSSHVGDHHFGQADNGVEQQSQYGWYDGGRSPPGQANCLCALFLAGARARAHDCQCGTQAHGRLIEQTRAACANKQSIFFLPFVAVHAEA